MKEPIISETPGSPKNGSIANKEKKKQVDIVAKIRISSDFADNFKIGFEIVTLNSIPMAINNNVLREGAIRLLKLISFDDNNVMAIMAMISWTNNIPIAILACRVFNSFLSDKSFTTIAVEEKGIAKATQINSDF